MQALRQLGKDAERLGPALVAVASAIALGGVLLAVHRGVNRPPAISAIEVKPGHVARGATAIVYVTADDPDGDALTYAYSADSGRMTITARIGAAQYAPGEAADDRVTVTVTDARGLATHVTTVVTIGEAPTPAPTAPPPDASSADTPPVEGAPPEP